MLKTRELENSLTCILLDFSLITPPQLLWVVPFLPSTPLTPRLLGVLFPLLSCPLAILTCTPVVARVPRTGITPDLCRGQTSPPQMDLKFSLSKINFSFPQLVLLQGDCTTSLLRPSFRCLQMESVSGSWRVSLFFPPAGPLPSIFTPRFSSLY